MGLEQTARLLDCYRIAIPPWRVAADPEEAGRAADELGRWVALKAQGPGLLHKTETGAVRIRLSGGAEVSRAAEEMDEAIAGIGARRESFVVQAMVEGGVELLVGVVGDPTFGPVLACGAGGTQAELLKDVAVRICPIASDEAQRMLRSLATFPLLTGFRGSPEADLEAVHDLLLRVSAMVETHHEIAELDLNPVLAGPEGALAVDFRVRVKSAPPRRPWPATWK
jgi:acyl-CoA synthetase (NDP forming)